MMYTALLSYPNLTQGLKHYYKLDTNANDSAPSGAINGSSTNMTYSSTYGYISGGAFFSESLNASVSFGTGTFFGSPTTDRSYAFWINPKRVNDGMIFSNTKDGEIYIRISTESCSATTVRCYVMGQVNGSYQTWYTPESSVVVDAWTHYVVSFSLINRQVKQYLNGSHSATGVINAGNLNVVSLNSRLGADVQGTPGSFYKGNIDEACFWNRALTESDVANLYNGSSGITYPLPT